MTPTRTHSRGWRRTTSAIAIAVFVVAGCGPDDEQTVDTGPDTGAPAPPTEREELAQPNVTEGEAVVPVDEQDEEPAPATTRAAPEPTEPSAEQESEPPAAIEPEGAGADEEPPMDWGPLERVVAAASDDDMAVASPVTFESVFPDGAVAADAQPCIELVDVLRADIPVGIDALGSLAPSSLSWTWVNAHDPNYFESILAVEVLAMELTEDPRKCPGFQSITVIDRAAGSELSIGPAFNVPTRVEGARQFVEVSFTPDGEIINSFGSPAADRSIEFFASPMDVGLNVSQAGVWLTWVLPSGWTDDVLVSNLDTQNPLDAFGAWFDDEIESNVLTGDTWDPSVLPDFAFFDDPVPIELLLAISSQTGGFPDSE